MPRYRVELNRTITYRTQIHAWSADAARDEINKIIDCGEYDDLFTEYDDTGYEIQSVSLIEQSVRPVVPDKLALLHLLNYARRLKANYDHPKLEDYIQELEDLVK